MIRRSSYFDGKKFRFEGRDVEFLRIWGGVSFDGYVAVLIGEERFGVETYYYQVAEAEEANAAALIDTMRVLAGTYSVGRWVGLLDKTINEFITTSNRVAYRDGLRSLTITPAVLVGDYIDIVVAHIYAVLTPVKRLHFFAQSSLPAALKGLPSVNIRPEEHPRVAALAYCLSGMLRYGAESYRAEDLVPACYED